MSKNKKRADRSASQYQGRLTRAEQRYLDDSFYKLSAMVMKPGEKVSDAGRIPSRSQLSARKRAVVEYSPIALRSFMANADGNKEGGIGSSGITKTKDESSNSAGENSRLAKTPNARYAKLKPTRDDILQMLMISVLYPVNLSSFDTEEPSQWMACAMWLLDYFDAYDSLITTERF